MLLLGIFLAACSPAATPEPAASGDEGQPVAVATVAPMVERATATAAGLPTASVVTASVATATVATVEPATLPAEPTPELPEPTPDAAPAVSAGRTDEGAFFYGSPDAPVTLIDYSDFL